jgi:Icc-related predicted phosphoesterase
MGMPDGTSLASNGNDRAFAHPTPIRVAAVGDLHVSRTARGELEPLLRQISESADVLALCGDLTNHGLAEEAQVLAKDLAAAAKLPIVAVLGNHDYEAGQVEEIRRALTDAGVEVLDGDAREIKGVGFAGIKGFCGGFGRGTLSSFGESAVKRFVQEAVDETMKLETALQQLRTPHRIAVLHYSPVRDTVEGEPLEIYPFLGCSRMEEPINRYQVSAAVHGHAHRGAPEGKTGTGIPVYNVAVHVMRRAYPGRPTFRLLTLPVSGPGNGRAPSTEGKPVETHVHAGASDTSSANAGRI